MYFDFVKDLTVPGKGKKFGGAEKLHELCIGAERNARTNPDDTMIGIRKALEALVRGLLMEDGNENGKYKYMDLQSLIEIYADNCDFIKNKMEGKLHNLRSNMNKYVHVSVNTKGEEEYEIRDKHATEEVAEKSLITLYVCLKRIFELKKLPYIEREDFPIGEYEVIKKIPAEEYESVYGQYKYIGRKSGIDQFTYVYIRPYNPKLDEVNDVFHVRDSETQEFFKNMRGSTHIIRGTEIQVADYCDVHYLAYEIREHTVTLDQMIGSEELTSQKLLDIILQVSMGLSDLITDRVAIHHRNIRPSFIFVTPFENGIEAQLGCFEAAKIVYSSSPVETITQEEMTKAQERNPFVHPKLQSKPDGITNKEWEAGDVYSLALILLYCVDKKAVEGNRKDCSVLLDDFSDQFYDDMEFILGTESLEVLPTMKEFCTILGDEMDRLKN